MADEVMERLRKIMENYENGINNTAQGFGLIHSMGGGTGAGVGSLLTTKIKDEYPKLIIYSLSVLPSIKVSDVVVEPYTTVLTLNATETDCDFTFIIDNTSLYNMVKKQGLHDPKYSDLNKCANEMVYDVSMMFGSSNVNLRGYKFEAIEHTIQNNNQNNTVSLLTFERHMIKYPTLKK